MNRVGVVAVLLMATLAGCTTTDGTSSDAGEGAEMAAGHVMYDLTFADTNTSNAKTYAGVFQMTDNAQTAPATAAAGQGGPTQLHDVSEIIPLDVPVMLNASVTPDNGRVVIGLRATNPGDVWSTSCTGCADTELEAAITRSDTIELVAIYTGTALADLPDHADGIEYSIDVRVTGQTDVIMAGMVLAVDLPAPGTHVLFEGIGGPVPDVLMFGPEDAFVGVLGTGDVVDTRLGPNGTTGEYVFLPKGHGQMFRLRVGTSGDEPSVRVLDQVVDIRGPWQPTSGETNSWTENSADQPLQVIVCIAGSAVTTDAAATVTGPSGDVVALDLPGPYFGAMGTCAATAMGDETLLAGDYTVDYTDTRSEAASVQLIFITYGR